MSIDEGNPGKVRDVSADGASDPAPASSTPTGKGAPGFVVTASRQFASWLAESGVSLAISTYQSGKVFLIGSNRQAGRLSVFERTLERPMGLAFDKQRLAVASMIQITSFVDAARGMPGASGYDALFVPQSATFTADIDIHDITFDAEGKLVFVNTLFSCLATTSETHSFKVLWKPPFISRLAPEDRCHLNGLAMHDGKPAYVSCIADTDIADGWREHRVAGGIVVDVASGEIVCRGLSMPHSPRLHEGRLWVLNSGAGELGTIDLGTGRFEPLTFCPGYLRGLAFIGPYALVGLSEPRENRTFAGLPLQDRLAAAKVRPRCGVFVIDTRTGDVAHWLRFEAVITELYDVITLPGLARPMMIGFRNEEIRRTVSIE